MGSDFMQQFMAGWQMGHQRKQAQRQDQELMMEQQRQAQRAKNEELDRQMRMEQLKIQQQELKTQKQKLEFEGKAQQAAMLSKQQEVLPAQSEDLGGGAQLNMGPAVQPREPIMAQVPGTEGPQVPMPFMEDIQEKLLAEKQQKMREALGMLEQQERVKAEYREKPKTIQDIFNEARARAAGGRAGAPPAPPQSGSMTGEGGKPLLSSEIAKVTELDQGLKDAETLKTQITSEGGTGAASALGAMIPNAVTEFTGIGSGAKKRQAVIARVKQIIGKALEGGVLRKEDEEKYAKILPTISDPPDVAQSKIEGLITTLTNNRDITLENYKAGGRDVANFQKPRPANPAGKYKIVEVR